MTANTNKKNSKPVKATQSADKTNSKPDVRKVAGKRYRKITLEC